MMVQVTASAQARIDPRKVRDELLVQMSKNLQRAAIHLESKLIEKVSNPPGSAPWQPPGVQSGHLQGNIRWHMVHDLLCRVGTGVGTARSVGYAMWLEFGTRKKTIVPKRKKYLSWVGKDGVRRFAKKVTREMLPRPWFRPTIWEERAVLEKYCSGLDESLKFKVAPDRPRGGMRKEDWIAAALRGIARAGKYRR